MIGQYNTYRLILTCSNYKDTVGKQEIKFRKQNKLMIDNRKRPHTFNSLFQAFDKPM